MTPPNMTNVLGINIVVSELFLLDGQKPPTPEEQARKNLKLDFSDGDSLTMAAAYNGWDRYTPDSFYGRPTATRRPALYLNGNADTATPIYYAYHEFERADVSDKRFVLVDGS